MRWPTPLWISADYAIQSAVRLPFRDFSAEEFLGRTLTNCGGGCKSVFQGSIITLGQIADACIYVGVNAVVDSKAKPTYGVR